jgi:RNA polymerase sigma-70 factor (ECF subfamily)
MLISPAAEVAASVAPITGRAATQASGSARLVSAERIARAKASQAEAGVDRALVRRFNGGDHAAFTEIVGRHRERIMALAFRRLRNHADAEEVAQDTFMRAHRGLARFRGESSLATWIHRIGFNLARNRYWYFFRRRRHLTFSLDVPLNNETRATFGDLVPSEEPDPSRQAVTDEFLALVATGMQQLDASHRELLVLRNELHRTYEEIARALGINEGTVKSRIARARGKLRELMTVACPEYAKTLAAPKWFEPTRTNAAMVRIAA